MHQLSAGPQLLACAVSGPLASFWVSLHVTEGCLTAWNACMNLVHVDPERDLKHADSSVRVHFSLLVVVLVLI